MRGLAVRGANGLELFGGLEGSSCFIVSCVLNTVCVVCLRTLLAVQVSEALDVDSAALGLGDAGADASGGVLLWDCGGVAERDDGGEDESELHGCGMCLVVWMCGSCLKSGRC
jgi:hypothetical protein